MGASVLQIPKSHSKGDRERTKLFRVYSANLAHHLPHLAGKFVCPICAKIFSEADVLHGSGLKVDIGHAFPAELGGTLTTLECCECNRRLNRAGDSEIVKLFKQWEAMRPDNSGRPIRGHLQLPSGRVGVDISAQGWHSHFSSANPTALQELLAALQNKSPFTLHTPAIDRQKMNLGFLHSAYLLMFRAFGYAYLCTPGGRYVRELLANNDSIDDNTFITVEIPKAEDVDLLMLFRVGVGTLPSGEKYLFAALPVAEPSVAYQILWLPSPWDKDGAEFKQLLSHDGKWVHGMSYRTIDRGLWQHLVAPEYKFSLALAWAGWDYHKIDISMLMTAIRSHVHDDPNRRADAHSISKRLGILPWLDDYIRYLVAENYLTRAPKRGRPYLVKITEKAAATR